MDSIVVLTFKNVDLRYVSLTIYVRAALIFVKVAPMIYVNAAQVVLVAP